MQTISLRLPPHRIALFKAIVESYDNLATLRTEDPSTHRLCLFFAAESAAEVEELLGDLAGRFEIVRA